MLQNVNEINIASGVASGLETIQVLLVEVAHDLGILLIHLVHLIYLDVFYLGLCLSCLWCEESVSICSFTPFWSSLVALLSLVWAFLIALFSFNSTLIKQILGLFQKCLVLFLIGLELLHGFIADALKLLFIFRINLLLDTLPFILRHLNFSARNTWLLVGCLLVYSLVLLVRHWLSLLLLLLILEPVLLTALLLQIPLLILITSRHLYSWADHLLLLLCSLFGWSSSCLSLGIGIDGCLVHVRWIGKINRLFDCWFKFFIVAVVITLKLQLIILIVLLVVGKLLIVIGISRLLLRSCRTWLLIDTREASSDIRVCIRWPESIIRFWFLIILFLDWLILVECWYLLHSWFFLSFILVKVSIILNWLLLLCWVLSIYILDGLLFLDELHLLDVGFLLYHLHQGLCHQLILEHLAGASLFNNLDVLGIGLLNEHLRLNLSWLKDLCGKCSLKLSWSCLIYYFLWLCLGNIGLNWLHILRLLNQSLSLCWNVCWWIHWHRSLGITTNLHLCELLIKCLVGTTRRRVSLEKLIHIVLSCRISLMPWAHLLSLTSLCLILSIESSLVWITILVVLLVRIILILHIFWFFILSLFIIMILI